MYFAYVLENSNGLLYKGHTSDLEKRLLEHNADDGFDSYTKRRGPWKEVHSEAFRTRKEAKAREMFFKTGKGRDYLKEILIGGRMSHVGQ
ncbi:GIY-YIG nuclease family protein [Candidatus Peribacteria bacterium]|nr:GIY-YIG nuclease family protein [Candidatus Peribacteria bacterium]